MLVGALFAADKMLGIVRDMAIGRAFGASAALDAYYAAFELPDGLFTVIAGSAMATALIPILSARIAQKNRTEVWRLVSAVVNLALLVVAAVSVVAAVFAPQIIAAVAPGFDGYRIEVATRLMRVVLLQTVVSSASGIVMSVLQAHQHFLLPAAAPLAYTVGRIVGALFLSHYFGIYGLALGGLAGSLGHLLIQVPGLVRYRAEWRPVLWHADLPDLLRLMGPRMLGLGATYLTFVLPTFLGSRLPAGAISAYEYAWRLMQFPETIIGTALGLTIFPTLAERANAGDRAGLHHLGGWALRLILALVIPAAVLLLVIGRPLTMLFLQRGAFDAAATARVYLALQFLALGLIGHSALEVVSRSFYAQRDMWTPLWAAVTGLAINAATGWFLLPVLAQGSIALANSLGVCCEVLLLLAIARIRLGRFEAEGTQGMGGSLARVLVASGLMAGSVYLIAYELPGLGTATRTLLSLAGGGIVYLLAAVLLGNAELKQLLALLVRRGQAPVIPKETTG